MQAIITVALARRIARGDVCVEQDAHRTAHQRRRAIWLPRRMPFRVARRDQATRLVLERFNIAGGAAPNLPHRDKSTRQSSNHRSAPHLPLNDMHGPPTATMFISPQPVENTNARFDLQTTLATIVVPIAALLASTQVDPESRKWLFGMGSLAIIANGAPHGMRWWRRWRKRRSDVRLASECAPRIQRLFARFGYFVSDDSGTLHHVVRNHLQATPRSVLDALNIGDHYALSAWWSSVNERVQAARPSIGEAVRTMGDLCALMNMYKIQCFDPVFDRATPELLRSLTPEARAELEAAREQYAAYRTVVNEAAEHLVREAKSVAPPRWHLQQPKPLRSLGPS